MACCRPITIFTPETRLLQKCRHEGRSFEYFVRHANQRRNLIFDPTPICDSPYDYYNKSLSRTMQVPCGKCPLCLKAKVDGYVIRNYFEFLHTTLVLHGSSWFITLTYADDILPKVRPQRVVISTGELITCETDVPCFSKEHIQKFLKRLRKYSGLDFKYFIVTEFGGEFGRPHYHGILHIRDFESNESNRLKLLQLIAYSWTKRDDRKDYYALCEYNMLDVQRVDVQPIQDTKRIRYTCKYVGKQIGAREFDKLYMPKENKRFHLQSIGLGEHIYEYCNKDCWHSGRIQLDGYSYNIPQYYKLHLCREYMCTHENGSLIYRPTSFKYQYIYELSLRQIQEHKNMAALNVDYPDLPSWVYDPRKLDLFSTFLLTYSTSRDLDNPFLNFPEDVASLYESWYNFLLDVQTYNRDVYISRAKELEKKQKEEYERKTGRR